METQNLGWHAGRVLFGLSRIGYRPHDAIADIVDNSINYSGKNIQIFINKERKDLADNRKNNIREYLIIDDGIGMDKDGIIKALSLGSDELSYDSQSLSKFGLGLKSASFSLGKILEVVSSNSSAFIKYQVNLNEIKDSYFCTRLDLNDEDRHLITQYIPNGTGTIIRVSDIHKANHPSLKKTIDMLEYKLGAIYFFFLKDGINIFLNGKIITPYDVLFTDEAENNGNLNEHEWNGRETKWIKKPTTQTLDINSDDSNTPIKAIVEVTQLPHPPTFDLDGEGERVKVRDKYKIESGNHGYYVYRNKRLISWAERFDGIISNEQDYWSFRGRILLDTTADDAFNIDVKKSHLELSSEAWDALNDLTDEYKRKSKLAWQHAKKLKSQITGSDTNTVSNDIASSIEITDLIFGQMPTPEEEKISTEMEQELKEKIKEKVINNAKEFMKDGGEDEPSEDEIKEYASGGSSPDKRIFRVSHVEDNLLWEPYYDDDHGWSVRINQNHRFARLIFEDNEQNIDLCVIFDLLMLHLAHAEVQVRKSPLFKSTDSESIIYSFREAVSALLVRLIRNKNIKLPPAL